EFDTATPSSPPTASTSEPAKSPRINRAAARVGQNYQATMGLQKHAHTITVGRPSPEVWFRTHPDDSYQDVLNLLHLKDGPNRGTYFVAENIMPHLEGERGFKPTLLVLSVDRQGEVYLWPLRVARPGDRE